MKREDFVISPALAEKIKKTGIRWKATWYWKFNQATGNFILVDKVTPFMKNTLPAYNVSELGMLIPYALFDQMLVMKFVSNIYKVKIDDKWKTVATEAEARGIYLLHLIETGKTKVIEVTPKSAK